MILEVEKLNCGYNKGFSLRNISFSVRYGEFVGIIGPNGSGKTTLLKAITRILKPFSGKIYFNGKDIFQLDFKEIAQNIAVVAQNIEVCYMTVQDFVLLGRIPYFKKLQFFETSKDEKISNKYIRITELSKLKDKIMTEISGGERQLAVIARALAQEPKLLLLDEPIAHLDISHQVKILNLIKKLNKKMGLTVIIILHNLNFASEYCDRLILLHNGRIYKTGTAEQVLTYQIIEKIYNTTVVVERNPLSGKPYILLPGYMDQR